MRNAPAALAASLLFCASFAAASAVDVNVGTQQGTPGTNAGASVTNPATGAGAAVNPAVTPLTSAPGLSAAPGAFSAPGAAAGPTAAAPVSAAPGSVSPAVRAAAASAPSSRPAASPAVSAAAPAGESAARAAAALHGTPAAADGAVPAQRGPAASSSLGGAARKVGDAARAEAAGVGDGLSVSRALDKVFDAASARPGLRDTAAAGVAGSAQSVRGAIAQKVGIANTSSPADAPGLYQDAIKTAKDNLPASVADGVAAVVKGFAARKADVSLGDLAAGAYRSAAAGQESETKRQLGAFDKWESLLGAPSRPLVANLEALKTDVTTLLAKAAAGAAGSAPHVWFAKKDGAYTAVLPGAGVAKLPALAASFAISPAAFAPATPLADAYRAFAASPRASTGAGLVYRARRALGDSVPSAVLGAGRFWLRTLLASVWRRFVALVTGAKPYALAEKAGQDALKRDLAAVASVRSDASAAGRLLAETALTVADARAAFAAAARAAAGLRALTGESDAAEAVAGLSRAFESAAAARRLGAGDEVPSALADLLAGPGALAHWAGRVDAEASRAVDARFWRSRAGADFVNLGASRGVAVSAAALAKESGASAAFVVQDERLWARGTGANGEARLSADLRPAGGSVELSVDRADAALGRRLEDLGFTVVPEGKGLRASITPEDFARDGEELGLVAARALAASLGRAADPASSADLAALADEARRDPKGAAALAARLDGREAFVRAPVIGLVGEYEAVGPVSVILDGKPAAVTALRDPDTGLLSYARAVKPAAR